jgi:inward rectifier potassium channel
MGSKFNRRWRHPPHNLRVRLRQRDGHLEIEGLGTWHSYWRDPYHLLLTLSWFSFFGIVAVSYIVINAIFASLYLLQPDSLANARSGSFEDAFFFSVQTLASIGYGAISPQTTYANILVTLEAVVGLLLIAMVTGLAFARFTKPTARVIFSRISVVSPHNGVPTLMLRAANQRRNYILEAQAKIYFICDEATQEGKYFRRIYDLKLSREMSPSFNLPWTIMHPIDGNSPLLDMTPERWQQIRPQIIVSLTGLDETVAYSIHARHVYGREEVLWNYQFADILRTFSTGDACVDLADFHTVMPVES